MAYQCPYYVVLSCLGCIIIFITVSVVISNQRRSTMKELTFKDQEYNQKATDALMNYETVKYFNAEKHELTRYKNALLDYKKVNIRREYGLAGLNISQQLIIAFNVLLVLLLLNEKVGVNEVSSPEFVMIWSYFNQLQQPLNNIGFQWRMFLEWMVDIDLIFDLLELKDSTRLVESVQENLKPQTGLLEFKNVNFGYVENKPIFTNLSFKLEAGKSLAIVGPTGAGKSTIARLIYRFYDIQGGVIAVDGTNIKEIKTDELRESIAIVPQDTILFNDTIEYNLIYGGINNPDFMELYRDSSRKIEFRKLLIQVTKKAQIYDFIMSQKDGFQTVVYNFQLGG